MAEIINDFQIKKNHNKIDLVVKISKPNKKTHGTIKIPVNQNIGFALNIVSNFLRTTL